MQAGSLQTGSLAWTTVRLTVWRNDPEPGAEESNGLLDGSIALGLVQAVAA